jgi:hypothetical protein
VLTADHVITDRIAFRSCLARAFDVAADGWLVTFGIRPTHPETGYGYVRLGVRIDPDLWSAKALPDHLRVRVEVVDGNDKVLCASRDIAEIQTLLLTSRREVSRKAATTENAAWQAARARWEGEPAADWKFGDLPRSVRVEERHGVPVLAFPGLKATPAGVAVRLFAAPEEAADERRGAFRPQGARDRRGRVHRHAHG